MAFRLGRAIDTEARRRHGFQASDRDPLAARRAVRGFTGFDAQQRAGDLPQLLGHLDVERFEQLLILEFHRLLGEVMQTLLRHRHIPEDVLQGVLATQDPPLPASALQPGRLQSLGEFWQALGGKPKAALNYSVTVSIDLAAREEIRVVTDKVLKLGTLERVSERRE